MQLTLLQSGANPGTSPGLALIAGLVVVLLVAGKLQPVGDGTILGEKQDTEPEWSRDDLLEMSPREFEHAVATLYEARGYQAEVSSKGPDAGLDVLARGDSESVAVQAKCYDPSNTVQRRTVQRIDAVAREVGADSGAVVTTSWFSDPALESASTLDVEVMDGPEVANRLNRMDISHQEIPDVEE